MANTNAHEKLTVLFLDHTDAVEVLVANLGQMKCTSMTPVTKLSEIFDIRSVIIPSLVSAEELAKTARKAVGDKMNGRNGLVLVDLCFDDRHDKESVDIGRQLAFSLKTDLWPMPVGVYTTYDLSDIELATISSEGFAIILNRIRDRCDPKGKDRLSGSDWRTLLTNTVGQAKQRAAHCSLTPLGTQELPVKWATGHPTSDSPSFREAAPRLAAKILSQLEDPASEVSLRQMSGGFSGAYLAKAELADRNKSFVIKIHEDPAKIQQELEGYRHVQSFMAPKYYLPVEPGDPSTPIVLSPNMWAAFAMSYEGTAKPLIENLNLEGEELASILRSVWHDCLYDLYGTIEPRTTQDTDFLSESEITKCHDALEVLERYRTAAGVPNKTASSLKRCCAELRKDDFLGLRRNVAFNLPWAKCAHGDLNCRNIMYDANSKTFLLIDFPNVQEACLANDFVKAEAEVILILLDWNTGLDCDLNRLPAWTSLTGCLTAGITPVEPPEFTDPELKKSLLMVQAIREAYTEKASNIGQIIPAYGLSLASRLVRYLRYPDITPAKKLLALVWLDQLASGSWWT